MISPSANLRLALLALLTFALSLPTSSLAIDAGDMDPRLPDAAILATMRFHSSTRKVEGKKAWDKEHAKLLAVLDAELEKASVSDNRAATALRTLIADLKDAKYVPQKKAPKKPANEYPVLPDGHRVMVKQNFHIKKAEERVLTFPFVIKRVPAKITVGIGGASDDSGDRGLRYLLVDPLGRVIKRGFADKDEYVWVEQQSTRSGKWKVILEDLDTDLKDKKSPGNRGAVEVLVKAE